MAEAARGSGQDTVNTVHSAVGGSNCDASPLTIATDVCSSKVKVEGYGIVREGDAVQPHTFPSCSTHAPGLSSFSSKVKVEGKGAGRKGDTYGCGATIMSGSGKVAIG